MKKLTRVLCVLLSILMVAVVFAGCKTTDEPADSSTIEVTSVAPPKVEIEKADEYTIAAGSTIVTVITDNETGVTAMKVAEGTTLKVFLETVTATEGYTIKVTDASGNEVTDENAMIANDFGFAVYKDGEETAVISHKIQVVTEQEIESAISQAESEAARVESETQLQQSQIAANSNIASAGSNASKVTINVSGFDGPSGTGPADSGATEQTSSEAPAGDIVIRSHGEINGTTEAYTLVRTAFQNKAASLGLNADIAQDPNALNASTIANIVMSGERYADLFETTSGTARELAKSGAITTLNGHFDLNASWLSKGVSDTVTYAKGTYGVAASGMATSPMGVTFNVDMVAMYAPEYDIYQLYKDREWTADVYAQIMQLCTKDLNGSPNTYEVFGMTSNTNVIGIALSSFSGGTDAKDSRGYIYPCFTTEAGIQSLEWCKAATVNGSWKYIADINSAVNYFASEGAASVVTYMWAASSAAQTADFEIGFVPFPMGGNQTDYVSQTYNTSCWCVPITAVDRIDNAAKIFSALGDINNQLIQIQVDGMDDYLSQDGIDVYRWCVTNMTADYSGGVHSGTVSQTIDSCCLTASKEPASEMAKIADMAQKECDDWYGSLTGQPG